MVLSRTKNELRSVLGPSVRNASLGLVPTMGALHPGHLSLVERAVSENELVVVSIFVNPTQFNNPKDLEKYPQNLDKDMDLLRTISGDIIVFAPSIEEIYPDSVASKSYDFNGLDTFMEGAYRKGHFDGVATIVEALLRLIAPNKAYFGEKDFQQLLIIKKIVEINAIDVDVIGCAIVRESNGLAMSSRNERLSNSTRKEAGFIYQTLMTAKKKFGMKSANYVKEWVQDEFKEHPKFKLEYFEIMDAETLTPFLKKNSNQKYRAFIAVYADGVRLIDNIAL